MVTEQFWKGTKIMLLTKECDYGLRILRELGDGKLKTMQAICDKELIPYKYAYKIIKKLHKAELVQNKRGVYGGYFLQQPLNTLSVYDVVTAIDDRLFIFECIKDPQSCPLNNADSPCAIHLELDRIQNLLIQEMKSKSIEEILKNRSVQK
jgi:Rrf2 family protein